MFIFLDRELRHKLSIKSIRTCLIRYDDKSKVYRCYDPLHKKIYISRDVIFNEQVKIDFQVPHSPSSNSFTSIQASYIPPESSRHPAPPKLLRSLSGSLPTPVKSSKPTPDPGTDPSDLSDQGPDTSASVPEPMQSPTVRR